MSDSVKHPHAGAHIRWGESSTPVLVGRLEARASSVAVIVPALTTDQVPVVLYGPEVEITLEISDATSTNVTVKNKGDASTSYVIAAVPKSVAYATQKLYGLSDGGWRDLANGLVGAIVRGFHVPRG